MESENWIDWQQFGKFMKNFWRIFVKHSEHFTANEMIGAILRSLSILGLYAEKAYQVRYKSI